MRIVVINPGGNRSGGAERSMALLIAGLTARKHEVGVVTLMEGSAADAFAAGGAHVLANGIRAGMNLARRHAGATSFLLGSARMAPEALLTARSVRALALNFGADVVHTNGLRANVLTPLLGPTPVIWHLRDRPSNELAQLLVRLSARQASAVIAPSDFASRLVWGCRAPVYVIPNPVSAPPERDKIQSRLQLSLPVDRRIVGVAAHLHRTKGHHVAVEAWSRLCEPRPVLALAGSTLYGAESQEYRGQIWRAILANGLVRDVIDLGLVDDMDIFYAACDALVHPAIHPEGFGRAIAEAQVSGTPVVATALGAALELIRHGETGLLVPAGDPESLAATVARLMSDTALRCRLKTRGKEMADKYRPLAHAKAVESVYRAVLK